VITIVFTYLVQIKSVFWEFNFRIDIKTKCVVCSNNFCSPFYPKKLMFLTIVIKNKDRIIQTITSDQKPEADFAECLIFI
jgi:hypothetical protein